MPLTLLPPVADKAGQCAEESLDNTSVEQSARASEREPSHAASEPQQAERAAAILVVEDEGVVAVLLMRKLRAWGYLTPEHAVTGQQAIEKAQLYRPDLILMDIHLRGDMDGIAAAARIQAEMDVPAIFATAYTDPDTIRRVEATNCYGFLIKPIADHALRLTVADALARAKREREARQQDAEEGDG